MDHLGCEKKPNDGRRSQHQGAGLHGELHALPHPVQPPRTVVEAYYRLKPLAEADDDGHDEGKHLGHDPHGGHRRVAVEPRIEVQRHGGHTGHALPQEGRQTAFQDVSIHLGLSGDEPGADPDVALPSHKEGGQDSQADALAEQGGDGRPGDAHVKGEDQDGVQHDVQQSAESQADHRPVGLSLPPQQIVEDIGQDHHRGTEYDIPGVV